jgi:hypothetical protein
MEGGMFYEHGRNSETLRLTIITMTAPRKTEAVSVTDVLQVV